VYETPPTEIAADIMKGVESLGEKKKASSVLTVLDRKEALAKALEIAEPKDLIIVTGKGSEQFLVLPGNKRIDWDERTIIEELLK